MSERDREFNRYYDRFRVGDQAQYYRSKGAWHGRSNERAIMLTGLLMFVASVASGVLLAEWEWLGPPTLWILIAALVPALSAAVASMRTLYEHERNHERFDNTRLDLDYLQAFQAPSTSLPEAEFHAALAAYVNEVEGLLSREHRQWVRIMEQVELRQAPEATSLERETGRGPADA